MKTFLEEILANKHRFITQKFSRTTIDKLRKEVIELLGLSSINQLRDKFEGVTFYEKYTTQSLGKLALEGLFQLVIIRNLKNEYITEIEGVEVLIITVNYGEFPIVSTLENRPIIFNIRRGEDAIWVCGIANPTQLKNGFLNNAPISLQNKNQRQFFNFTALITFKNLEDLKKIIREWNLN